MALPKAAACVLWQKGYRRVSVLALSVVGCRGDVLVVYGALCAKCGLDLFLAMFCV